MNISERIRQVLAIDPDATAIEFAGRSWSWGYLSDTLASLDAALTSAGAGPGASVGLLPRNRPPHFAALITVIATGRCVVTLSPMLADSQIAADIAALDLHAVVGSADDLARPGIREAAARSAVIRLDDEDAAVTVISGGPGGGRCRPGIAIEMLSSGTTGTPKRIPLRYASLQAAIEATDTAKRAGDGGIVRLQKHPALIWNPLVHIAGTYFAIDSAYCGRPTVLMERFSPESWAETVEQHQLYVSSLNPTAMRMVMDAGIVPGRLASLRIVRSGTAALPPELQAAFEERYGIPVLTTYGATEFAGAVAGWTLDDHRRYRQAKLGSSGRAHRGVQLRTIDRETGAVQPSGMEGVLEVRADQIGAGDWVRTTDLAMIDEDGFLWIRGRIDDAIIRGGFKVHPAKVQTALEAHPAVREAAVVDLPDRRVGAVPAAAVCLARDVAKRPTPEELLQFARERLAPYEVPVKIMIVEDLPRTPSLKVVLPALREVLAEAADG
jgi:long-chain acyl-CoA synthetase